MAFLANFSIFLQIIIIKGHVAKLPSTSFFSTTSPPFIFFSLSFKFSFPSVFPVSFYWSTKSFFHIFSFLPFFHILKSIHPVLFLQTKLTFPTLSTRLLLLPCLLCTHNPLTHPSIHPSLVSLSLNYFLLHNVHHRIHRFFPSPHLHVIIQPCHFIFVYFS